MPTLGQQLRQAREDKGLSLPDVSHKTRIPVARLEDLENDDYTSFSSPVYARGFLQSYAALVGIEPHLVTDEMIPLPVAGGRNPAHLGKGQGPWIAVLPDRSLTPAARPVRRSRLIDAVVAVLGMMTLGGVLWAAAIWTDHKAGADARRNPEPSLPATRGSFEEVRPALSRQPDRAHSRTSTVPVRKALPVEDPPSKKAAR